MIPASVSSKLVGQKPAAKSPADRSVCVAKPVSTGQLKCPRTSAVVVCVGAPELLYPASWAFAVLGSVAQACASHLPQGIGVHPLP